jgi:hypothetical protein
MGLGMTGWHAARALRTLRELGLIQTHRMRLIVLDLERLRSHAGQS